MNQVRVPFVRNGLLARDAGKWNANEKSELLNGFKILDVGCGGGIFSEGLAMLGASVVGIDPSEKLIACAKDHASKDQSLKVEYFSETIEDHLVMNGEKYDAVVASEVIEHVVDQKAFMKACVAALKPGGSIFITTFSKNWISWFCVIIMGEYVLKLLPIGSHTYHQFIDSSEVSNELQNLNCRTAKVVGLRYEFFRHVFKFSSIKTVSYALHAIKQSKLDES